MIAENITSNEIPPLRTSDSGLKAIAWMEEFKVSHLPIVNNIEYLGILSEEDVFNLNSPEDPIGNHELSLEKTHVKNFQHVFDVLKIMTELNLTLIPVLNDKNEYIGCITQKEIVEHIARISSVRDPGAILILEMSQNDYKLSEIAQIVESENGKILNLYINSSEDTMKMDVTIKINKKDLSAIQNAFLRYKYNIKALYHESEIDDGMRDRFDMLMNFLNM
jgi:predicted transcriptional regulator